MTEETGSLEEILKELREYREKLSHLTSCNLLTRRNGGVLVGLPSFDGKVVSSDDLLKASRESEIRSPNSKQLEALTMTEEIKVEENHYIMNSAVVTEPGDYRYELINEEDARIWIDENDWYHVIGYQETCSVFTEMFGVIIEPNREQIKMQDGDQALVFRLTKRISDIEDKGKVGKDEIRNHLELGLLTRLRIW